MVLINVGVKSTDKMDKPIEIFCNLTYNKSTDMYEVEYIGRNKQVHDEITRHGQIMVNEPDVSKYFDETYPQLKE